MLPIIFWKISYCIVRDFIVKVDTCLCCLIELLNTATKVCFFLVLSKYMSRKHKERTVFHNNCSIINNKHVDPALQHYALSPFGVRRTAGAIYRASAGDGGIRGADAVLPRAIAIRVFRGVVRPTLRALRCVQGEEGIRKQETRQFAR